MKKEIGDKMSHLRVCYPLDTEIQKNHKELNDYLFRKRIMAVDPKIDLNGNTFTGIDISHNDFLFYDNEHYMELSGNLDTVIQILRTEFGN